MSNQDKQAQPRRGSPHLHNLDVQVYLMDKRFLDPRRPHKAAKALTPAEQEERLIPYSPLLPLAPNSFATYCRAVARLEGAGLWSKL